MGNIIDAKNGTITFGSDIVANNLSTIIYATILGTNSRTIICATSNCTTNGATIIGPNNTGLLYLPLIMQPLLWPLLLVPIIRPLRPMGPGPYSPKGWAGGAAVLYCFVLMVI